MLEEIKRLCSDRGISISELEDACGLGTRTVYRWNQSSPSVEKVKKVADYFGVSVDSIITPTQ